MTVERIPFFLVREGRIVRTTGPRSWDPIAATLEASVERIKAAAKSGARVYVHDVDGVEAGAANHDFYQKLERAHVAPWVNPGCRTAEDVMDAFFAGADAVTMEPRLLPAAALQELTEIADGERHVGFPIAGRRLVPDLRPSEAARMAQGANAAGIVLEPAEDAEWHYVESLARELGAHRISVTLSLIRGPGHAKHSLASADFARVLVPEGANL